MKTTTSKHAQEVRAVFFDLDGTLVDTSEDIVEAVNLSLRKRELPSVSADLCRRNIGLGVDAFIWNVLGDVAEDLSNQVLADYRANYARRPLCRSSVYAGVRKLLSRLMQMDVRLAIVTNKPEEVALKMVAELFGHNVFDIVLGAKDYRPLKPSPEMGIELLVRMSLQCKQCVFVGDRTVDVAFARAVGMRSIGVTWGYESCGALTAAAPDLLVNTPDQIEHYCRPLVFGRDTKAEALSEERREGLGR